MYSELLPQKSIKILLVDDEFLALNLLEAFAGQMPGLEVVGKARTALAALDILEREAVDLLFLDIQMPVMSGVGLLKTLKNPPVTIFTTAYSEHAVEAFDLDAVDYLLKPFSFERFVKAVGKAKDALDQRAPRLPETAVLEKEKPEFIVVKVDGRLQKIPLNELMYVEGLKEYARFVCTGRQFVAFERLKNIEEMLPGGDFLRVHKSYIVARRFVQSLEGNLLDLGGKMRIPVSRERREEVMRVVFQR